jgi:serine/threonine protein kinase
MTPEQWERVARLYEAASALSSEERVAFLRETCEGDEALREELQSLLESEAAAGDFLTAGALRDAAHLLVQDNFLSLVGERLDSYEVLSLIGSGGMGEVYRAHDSRLGRDVAIKVLPALVTQSADARSRFEREARAVAAMSHPNIRSLYDVGTSHGRMYAVMELLEGETLRTRLEGGPLSTRKAVEIGAAIADGLAAAHAKGIVHRDLKPENVFITTDGAVKVLDFGLAKTLEPIAPQQVDRHTDDDDPGGTSGYMSPEQASGGKVDARSDLFSFGCVLYEMLIGRRSFERHTAPQLTAAILNEEPPDLDAIRADVRRIIAHCLEKEPQERFQSAQDLAFHLRGLNVAEAGGRQSARTRDRRAVWLVSGGIATVMMAFAAWLLVPSEPALRVQWHLTPSPNVTINVDLGVAISPDGRNLAYVARSSDDPKEWLWVQPLNGTPARRLSGTDGARFPFWSPDSRTIAFFTENALMRIEASGDTPRRLCSPVSVSQGAWSARDVIVFGGYGSGLRGVSSTGGDPFPVTELDSTRGEEGHSSPVFLADGRRLLFYTIANSDASVRGIYATSLDSKRAELVSPISSSPSLVKQLGISETHLVFVQEGTLMAAPFDQVRAP